MVGVCIKYFHSNYGGMLQAFATVSMLEDMRIDYELIRYEKEWTAKEIIKALPRLLNGVLLNDKYESLQKKIGLRKHPKLTQSSQIRQKAFDEFQKSSFIKLSPIYKGYEKLCKAGSKYSIVLSGSDQLWSPAGLPTGFYNLSFVPDNVRKVSWASSFGVSEIPWYQKKRTREYLERIQYISMRENRGAEIVEEITGRKVPVLMDPVFLFDKEDWNRLVPQQSIEWNNYIFCYFLGNNPEHRAAVRKLSAETGCKIVTLRHLDRYVAEDETFGDFAPYDVGPDRFLSILRNAKYVCTDSFHGLAFSIIFEKPFVVFDRYKAGTRSSKNSRIDSLCDNLKLSSRRYSGEYDIREKIEYPIEYDHIYQKLLTERSITKEYLKNIMS